MNIRKWLILVLAIVTVMSLATFAGVTGAFFVDDEQSSDDALGFKWGLITLTDGFEGTPWDQYWDENAITNWAQDSGTVHSGTYSAGHASGNTYLTSDEIDASASTNIAVSFWFNIKDLSKGPLYIQIYNGSTYTNWYDLVTYPGVAKNSWHQFTQTITASQYFIAGFSIRFDGSTLTTDAFIDDVLVEKN